MVDNWRKRTKKVHVFRNATAPICSAQNRSYSQYDEFIDYTGDMASGVPTYRSQSCLDDFAKIISEIVSLK